MNVITTQQHSHRAAVSSAQCTLHAGAATDTHLLLANKRAPEHADPLADHGNVELVLLLEPRDNFFEGGVILEFETVPQRPLRRPVLVLLGRYRFRETEER